MGSLRNLFYTNKFGISGNATLDNNGYHLSSSFIDGIKENMLWHNIFYDDNYNYTNLINNYDKSIK